MRHGSLFSGIGGFDLAAKWMGWENVFHCEYAEYPNSILKMRFPNAINYGKIEDTDFTIHSGAIDVLSGGFPCQPYSTAGKRLGKEDGRHLWPENFRAVHEIKPSWVVGENVRGLVNWSGGLVFDEVQSDLEAEGYEVVPFLLPACAVNAPHRRDRIFFIAHSSSHGQQRHKELPGVDGKGFRKGMAEGYGTEPLSRRWASPDSYIGGLEGRKSKKEGEYAAYRNAWDKFPTQSPVCGGNDGVPDRVDRIKALGNAVVPQVAYQIFKAIEEFEKVA